MDTNAMNQKLFQFLAVYCFLLDYLFKETLALRIGPKETTEVILSKGGVLDVVSSPCSISSGVDKDDHLVIGGSFHNFFVKDLIEKQHFSDSFLLSHSHEALLKRDGPVSLVEVEHTFFSDAQDCSHVLVIGQSG